MKKFILLPLLLLLLAALACSRADAPLPPSVTEPVQPTALPTETAVPTEAPVVVSTAAPTSEQTAEPTPPPFFFLREEVMHGWVVLEIPKIGVESSLRMAEEAVGPNGPYFTKPAEHPLWIPSRGAEIGNTGVALIYGHRQWGPLPKVFTALDRLEPGDQVIFRYRNEEIDFTVTDSVVVDPDQFWTTFFARDDAALHEGRIEIALLTCTPWGTDKQRLIVFAERNEEEVAEGN